MAGVLTLALAPFATAQEPSEEVAAHVYDLYLGAAVIGEVGVSAALVDGGFSLQGWSVISPNVDVRSALLTDASGAATGYRVEGEIQGVRFEVTAAFDAFGVDLSVTQMGATQTLRLASDEPLYVVDNNLIDGVQAAVTEALRAPAETLRVAAIVPQVAALGSLQIRPGAVEPLTWRGGTVAARRLEAVLEVAGQPVGMQIWVDDAGDILVLRQPQAGIEFVRRLATAEDEQRARELPTASPLTSAAALLEERATCVEEREVSVRSTGATLAGVLTLPSAPRGSDGERGAPALLLLPGSGAVDVDGNSLPVIANSGYRQLAYSLGCQGYAVLRIAKLGIPPSTGDGNAVTLDTYADNTEAWLGLLAQQPEIDGGRLGLMGHSEGGLVALYAIASGRAAPQALVLLAAPGRNIADIVEEQVVASVRRAGGSAREAEEIRQETREAMEALRTVEGTALELSGALAQNRIAALFAHAAGLMRSQLEVQPDELLAAIVATGALEPRRAVIVQGVKDLQITLEDSGRLAAAAPAATLLALPDMTHNLFDVAGPAELGLVPGPDTPISDTLLRALTSFLAGSLRTASP